MTGRATVLRALHACSNLLWSWSGPSNLSRVGGGPLCGGYVGAVEVGELQSTMDIRGIGGLVGWRDGGSIVGAMGGR
jgi:hypothetical protein